MKITAKLTELRAGVPSVSFETEEQTRSQTTLIMVAGPRAKELIAVLHGDARVTVSIEVQQPEAAAS